MAGTISTPIFKQDGQYLTFTVATGAITLGNVVMLNAAGTASVAGQSATNVIGVAVSGNRVSRTATDDTVAVGDKVTVITRGVVNCMNNTGGTIDAGTYVEAGATGQVEAYTGSDPKIIIGKVVAQTAISTAAPILLRI